MMNNIQIICSDLNKVVEYIESEHNKEFYISTHLFINIDYKFFTYLAESRDCKINFLHCIPVKYKDAIVNLYMFKSSIELINEVRNRIKFYNLKIFNILCDIQEIKKYGYNKIYPIGPKSLSKYTNKEIDQFSLDEILWFLESTYPNEEDFKSLINNICLYNIFPYLDSNKFFGLQVNGIYLEYDDNSKNFFKIYRSKLDGIIISSKENKKPRNMDVIKLDQKIII